MTGSILAANLARSALFAVAGLAFGWAYFAALRRTIDVYVAGRHRFVPAILTLARVAAATVFLAVAAQFGALPLLAAFLGFLGARALALHRARRVA
jgi:hypothetical protein